jgi:hypothetical protein
VLSEVSKYKHTQKTLGGEPRQVPSRAFRSRQLSVLVQISESDAEVKGGGPRKHGGGGDNDPRRGRGPASGMSGGYGISRRHLGLHPKNLCHPNSAGAKCVPTTTPAMAKGCS